MISAMSALKYSDLKNLLEGLEKNITLPEGAIPRGVRSSQNGSHIQGFGLDQSTLGATLPVIVAVGANYAQKNVKVPRNANPNGQVIDDLSVCRRHLKDALGQYQLHKPLWYNGLSASSQSIQVVSDFHLVLTNFCLWLTKDSWQNLKPQIRANLLLNNPNFNGQPSFQGSWPHLDALHAALGKKEAPLIWVAHGMHSEVFYLFREWISSKKSRPDWLLVPNLSFHYQWRNWSFV